MSLDSTIALTDVANVKTFMGLNAQKNGIRVYCSQGDATDATVEVTDLTLVLIIVGGTPSTTPLTFADADTNTIAKLIVKINAVTGWTANAIYNGSADSTDLIITGALDCLTIANEQTLKITDDYMIAELINMASDFINQYTGRVLKSTVYTHERYNGDGNKLYLNNYPVTAITLLSDGYLDVMNVKYSSSSVYNAFVTVTATGVIVTVDGTAEAEILFSTQTLSAMATAISAFANWSASVVNSSYNSYPASQLFQSLNQSALNFNAPLRIPDVPLDEYTVDLDTGIIELSSRFLSGFQNIFVSYTGGYTTIPASLEAICKYLVKYKYDQIKIDLNLKSEKIGEVYAYTRADVSVALPVSLAAELSLFVSPWI